MLEYLAVTSDAATTSETLMTSAYEPPTVPPDETEEWYARLPFEFAQRVFSGSGAVAATERRVTVGWHGTAVSDERGSFALVRVGGDLDDLIGRRVRLRGVGVGKQPVYVYVVGDADVEQDISVTRRVFLALGFLGRDDVSATATRLG